MKILILTTFILCILFNNNADGQLWKEYADSAKTLQEQNKFDKAIEIYTKAKYELEVDSAETMSYFQISYKIGQLNEKINQNDLAEQNYGRIL